MPWKVDPVPEQRTAPIHAVRTAGLSVAEAARRYGVSRETARKGLRRHDADPDAPPADRSRRPATGPARTPDEPERPALQARDRWGREPRELHARLLAEGHPAPPARAIAAILARHGRVRRPAPEPAVPPQRFERSAPDELRQQDFEGPLEVRRRRASPLAVPGDHSRYCLPLRPCLDQTYATAQAALWEAFGEVGPPDALLRDNAFAARNPAVGLSAFDARLIRPGIRPIHGRPCHPQTRGKPERLNGTAARELWPTARRDRLGHFAADPERWRPVYNAPRPHEATGGEPTAERRRPRPAAVPETGDPAGAELRAVGQGGDIRRRRARVPVGQGLAGQRVQVAEAEGHLEVYHGPHRVRHIATALLAPHQRA